MGKSGKIGNKVLVDEPLREMTREAVMTTQFREDMQFWTKENPRTALRAWGLINEIVKTPFHGKGKPEPLKYEGPNIWSRRLTDEHRIVYKVGDARIDFLQARYHYD